MKSSVKGFMYLINKSKVLDINKEGANTKIYLFFRFSSFSFGLSVESAKDSAKKEEVRAAYLQV